MTRAAAHLSLTVRTTGLLIVAVTFGILVMAGLGYSQLNKVTDDNTAIRIDRAARSAAVIFAARLEDRFFVLRNQDGHPGAVHVTHPTGVDILTSNPEFDAVLQEIGGINQGAASLFRFNPQTRGFDRFATTFRGPNGERLPHVSFGPAHPAYAALSAGVVYVGQVPSGGRLRHAYLVPIFDQPERVIGALMFDIGWVDDLLRARNDLRDDMLFWSILILVGVAACGAMVLFAELRPLRAIARFAHDLAAGKEPDEVPGRGRSDEIGYLADGLSRVVDLQVKLERLAYGDPLTGLANRAGYFKQLERSVALAANEGPPLGLVMLDLDRFKETNDAYGQAAGDELLLRARDIILAQLSEGDVVARLAGDDFVILTERAATPGTAAIFCSELATRLSLPIVLEQGEVHSGCSIGVAFLPAHGASAEEAHRNADLALRRAKLEGRGRVVFYDHDLNEKTQKTMLLARMLRQALENNELTVHLQPQVRVKDGKLHGFEALARWPHPSRGMIPPSEFIPVAEASGLIPELGQRVLDEACRIAREWCDAGFAFGHVSVNVSPIQLWQPNFVTLVSEALARHRLDGKMLCLEVTESVFVDHDQSRVMSVFGELRALGVSLSLDDFGSGYSSLGYLNTLPLDQLKIDRAFISGVDKDNRKRSLLYGIVALGKGLQLDLIAEGAETAEEVAVLREIGCAVVQGYFFGKPVPAVMAQLEADRIQHDHAPRRSERSRASTPRIKAA